MAVGYGSHASVVTVDASEAFPIADGTSFADASLVLLATIAGQGVRLAGLVEGDRFGMVGAGIIGSLAQRLAVARGAIPEAVVATSRAKEHLVLAGGAKKFVLADDQAEIAALELPVILEVTGDPQALELAVRMAAPGGRIVLLGSSRGTSNAVPVGAIRAKGLTLVGAHVDTLRREALAAGGKPGPDGVAPEAGGLDREATQYLELLKRGDIQVSDLTAKTIDPREAPVLYRELIDDRSIVGAALDWSRLPEKQRLRASHLLAPPDLAGRGVSFAEPAPPPAT